MLDNQYPYLPHKAIYAILVTSEDDPIDDAGYLLEWHHHARAAHLFFL